MHASHEERMRNQAKCVWVCVEGEERGGEGGGERLAGSLGIYTALIQTLFLSYGTISLHVSLTVRLSFGSTIENYKSV